LSTGGTVLITGGSRGIGAATVRLAVQSGFDVVFTYASREDAARALVKECRGCGRTVHGIKADVGIPLDIERLVASLPNDLAPLVGLVNNAGVTGPIGVFVETTVETMRRVTEVNFLGIMLGDMTSNPSNVCALRFDPFRSRQASRQRIMWQPEAEPLRRHTGVNIKCFRSLKSITSCWLCAAFLAPSPFTRSCWA
jgi:NAD(P)-dependent dehydrogenase (short-subunit alcohol dehydrogenase family)